MPGYNHYTSCTCGWCVKYGKTWAVKSAPYEISRAERILKKHGAHRAWTASFLNPNACCPICDAKVFYYENSNGSKVFFDDLGPPWPKHPCIPSLALSKRTKLKTNGWVTSDRIERHSLGTIRTIKDALSTLSPDTLDHLDGFYKLRDAQQLYQVLEAVRSGHQNFLRILLMSHLEDQKQFSEEFIVFDSAKSTCTEGEIISITKDYLAMLNMEAFKGKSYRYREIAENDFLQAKNMKG